MGQVYELLTQAGPFGLAAVPIIYWLVQHARRVGLITSPKVVFLTVGAASYGVVILSYVSVVAATLFLTGSGLFAAVLLFKSGAKDNERTKTTPTNQGAS